MTGAAKSNQTVLFKGGRCNFGKADKVFLYLLDWFLPVAYWKDWEALFSGFNGFNFPPSTTILMCHAPISGLYLFDNLLSPLPHSVLCKYYHIGTFAVLGHSGLLQWRINVIRYAIMIQELGHLSALLSSTDMYQDEYPGEKLEFVGPAQW